MFEVIAGGIFVIGTVALGVEKIKDITTSVKQDGFSETVKQESQKFNKYVTKEYDRRLKESQRRNKRK